MRCEKKTKVGENMYSHSSFCNVRFTNTINRINKVIVSSSPFHLYFVALQAAFRESSSCLFLE